jgi:transposase
MSDDLVERLREWDHGHKTMIVSEAITEIERLQRCVKALEMVIHENMRKWRRTAIEGTGSKT